MPDEKMTIKKSTLIVVMVAVVFLLAGFGIGWIAAPKAATGQAVAQGNIITPSQNDAAPRATVEVGDAPVKGNPKAKVTIIEFSDFSCPFCGAAAGGNEQAMEYLRRNDPSWEPPIPGIMKDYVNTGKARIAVKYFPGHGTGEEVMKIALCANEQGKFWEVHDEIFRNQQYVDDTAKMKALAAKAGVNSAKLESCLDSKKYDSMLISNTNEGRKAGVSGTPAFFINGIQVVGAQPYAAFKQLIEQELAA
ncbi:MAG: thioredoxin domain-containing protein [Candidatus Aenigmarchaeota archaeon]|nr:thioredoxin domain-containing protein [Candidatus Aenigmarchaeota archaeon]MDI6722163.1 thioredoxin domain-containing protein [Candidatus Aenigmarchaeota archaeon]